MYDFSRLMNAGISREHAQALRRISMTLHRWHELECGDGNDYTSWCIVRGKRNGKEFEYDEDGRPYLERHNNRTGTVAYDWLADRERGALKRLNAIMGNYPNLTAYVQGDPRGASLYIGEGLTDSNYSQGIAIYK